MRKPQRREVKRQPAPPSDIKYWEDVAGLFCNRGHTEPPSKEDGERLVRESLSSRHVAWYKQAAQGDEYEEVMSTKMLDLRANNPA